MSTKMDLFAKQAAQYAVFRPKYPQAIHKWLLNSVSHAGDVPHRLALDIGTGNGQVAVPLAKSGFFNKVIGMDKSPDQLKHAPSDIPNLTFQQGDALKLDEVVQPNSCALITAAQCAHWFVSDPVTWSDFKVQVARSLIPGGRFAVVGYTLCFLGDPKLQHTFMEFYQESNPLWDPNCRRDVIDAGFRGINWDPLVEVDRIDIHDVKDVTVSNFLSYVGTWSAFTHDDSLFKRYSEGLLAIHKPDDVIEVTTPCFGILFESNSATEEPPIETV